MCNEENNENLIQLERKRVDDYLEEFIKKDKKGRVRLTHKNATKIETLIRFNPRYGKVVDDDNQDCAMSLIKQLKGNDNLYTDKQHIGRIIGRINSENSTRMSGNDMVELRDIILSLQKRDLIIMLKNDNKKYELIDLLAAETKHDKHANFSFATKFCHYMCFYLFEGEIYQDNYSIYDRNVIKTISKYRDNQEPILPYCKTDKVSPAHYYEYYQGIIDKILKKTSNRISRNAFDHILWYYSKIAEFGN